MAIGWIKRHSTSVALAGIVALGVVLRLPGLDYCMAPDEAYTFTNNIVKGLRSILFGPYLAGNHIVTSVLAWAMYSLFGDHDWAFQLPVLILGIASILVAYPVGRLLFQSHAAGLSAAFFLAWAPYHVSYSVNARGYCPMFLFIMLSSALIYLNLQKATALRLLGLTLVTFLMGMSQMSSLILFGAWAAVLGGYAAAVLIHKPWRTRRKLVYCVLTSAALAVGLALIHIGYSPTFLLFHGVLGRAFHGQWPQDIAGFLAGAEQTQWHHTFWRYTEMLTGLREQYFWVACAVALVGILVSVRRGNYGALLCLAGIATPLAAMFVFHLMIEPRYIIFLLPFCVLALGAGTALCAEAVGHACAAGIGKIAHWMKRRPEPSEAPVEGAQLPNMGNLHVIAAGVAFVVLAAFFGYGTIPLYERNFPHYGPVMACVFNDYKSAERFIGAHASGDDIFVYPQIISFPVEHYAERYIYPALQPGVEPSRQFTTWIITTENYGGSPVPPSDPRPFVLKASYNFCYVWSFDSVANELQKRPLPPFQFTRGVQKPESLKPWMVELNSSQDKADLELTEDIEDPAERGLLVTGLEWNMHWRLFSPLESCVPEKLVLVRGQVRAEDTTHRSVALVLRFYDAEKALIEERTINVPSKQEPALPLAWKMFQLSALAPKNACNVSAGLQVATPVHVGVPVGFRHIELWVDGPPAQTAPTP